MSRAVALAIDAAVVQGTLLVIAALLALVGSLAGGVQLESLGQVIAAAGWLLATAGYFVIGWSVTGQTLGMRAMELRVMTALGLTPTLTRSSVRVLWLGLCILPLFAGFLPVLFDQRRRRASRHGVRDRRRACPASSRAMIARGSSSPRCSSPAAVVVLLLLVVVCQAHSL